VLPLRGIPAAPERVCVNSRSSLHHHLRQASRLSKIILGNEQVTLLCDARQSTNRYRQELTSG
jgi:hypothetical protein